MRRAAGDRVVDEQAACLPGGFPDRAGPSSRFCGIEPFSRSFCASRIMVGIDPAACGGRRQADAGGDAAIFMDGDPPAHRGVVLVELHPVDPWQRPFLQVDEALFPGTKDVGEQFAVNMRVRRGESGRRGTSVL